VSAAFPTTHWSLVVAAAADPSPRAQAALADLCARYRAPVLAFVRRHCRSPEEAQDLTQSFFARVIEKRDLADADRSRGRFRSFLLTACRHFLANEHDRETAQKRGGDRAFVPIDPDVAAHAETPEVLYERQWCFALLQRALDDVRASYVAGGKEAVFDRLRDCLTAEVDPGDHARAARDLNTTIAAVKVAVHRLRRRYRDALRRLVAETVDVPSDVEDELRHLLEVFFGNRRDPVS
jgi:RNA polymerase sigma-70 factor (ECF subfamily)